MIKQIMYLMLSSIYISSASASSSAIPRLLDIHKLLYTSKGLHIAPAVAHKSFPKENPFLSISTILNSDSCRSADCYFAINHGIRPFNNGHGLLIALLSMKNELIDFEKSRWPSTAQRLLNKVDTVPLQALLDKKWRDDSSGDHRIIISGVCSALPSLETMIIKMADFENTPEGRHKLRLMSNISGIMLAAYKYVSTHPHDNREYTNLLRYELYTPKTNLKLMEHKPACSISTDDRLLTIEKGIQATQNMKDKLTATRDHYAVGFDEYISCVRAYTQICAEKELYDQTCINPQIMVIDTASLLSAVQNGIPELPYSLMN